MIDDIVTIDSLDRMIRLCLSDELRRPIYRGNPCHVAGHCYVASEAAWHILGGPHSVWHPMFLRHECEPHWYLESDGGQILDITSEQFVTLPPYIEGKRKGFLTKEPSRRAAEVLRRVGEALEAGVRHPTFHSTEIGEDGRG
jgi:hypothetical protein